MTEEQHFQKLSEATAAMTETERYEYNAKVHPVIIGVAFGTVEISLN